MASEDVTSRAAFGELQWHVLDSVELAYGLRYINEQREFTSTQFDGLLLPYGAIQPPQPSDIVGGPAQGFPVRSDQEWSRTINKFTASWTASQQNNLCAAHSEGFRSGGSSLRGNDPEDIGFGPESANAYEIGSKNDLWNGRWRLNLAPFLTIQKNAQFVTFLQQPTDMPGTDRSVGINTIINDAGKSQIYGFELESTIVATDHLTFIASYGVQNANSDDLAITSRRYPFPRTTTPRSKGRVAIRTRTRRIFRTHRRPRPLPARRSTCRPRAWSGFRIRTGGSRPCIRRVSAESRW